MRPIVAVLAIAVITSPAATTAQETRTEILEKQRAEKATALAPHVRTRLEKIVMDLEEGRYRRLVTPHNGFFAEYGYTYRPVGAGIGFGGGFRHDLFDRNARIVLEGGATFRGYHMERADFSLPRLFDEHLEVGVEGIHKWDPQEDYYGTGPESLEDDRTSFRYQGREFQGRALVMPRQWFRVGTRIGRLSPDIGSGTDGRYPSIEERFALSLPPGLFLQPDYLYGEAFAAVDYRDEPGNARAGGNYSLRWRRYSDRDLDRFSFGTIDVLLQQFVPIFDKKRVFAFQTGLVATSAKDGHEVPFYMHPTVGGSRTLRSVAEYRFRDTNVVWMNIEYRWEAFGLLDMALFTDFGNATPSASDLFSDMKHAYGIGFRFNTAKMVFLRIDIATGAGEGIRTFFKYNKAF